MDKKTIKDIFNYHGINVNQIKKANNSFSSDVYIISSDVNKYVLKATYNQKKAENEKKYYNHLYKFLPTSKVIHSGKYNDQYYNIITYFEGNNKYDSSGNSFNSVELRKLGILLAKLHNSTLIDENDNWIEYINKSINISIDSLKKVIPDDYQIVVSFMKKYLEKNIIDNYRNCIIHTDFRIGNVIFRDEQIGLIDMESIKSGDYVFDFVKVSRIFNKKNFKIFLNGYLKERTIDNYFYDRLKFYGLFDSIISIEWCRNNKSMNTDYYRNNCRYLLDYLKEIKNGKWNI